MKAVSFEHLRVVTLEPFKGAKGPDEGPMKPPLDRIQKPQKYPYYALRPHWLLFSLIQGYLGGSGQVGVWSMQKDKGKGRARPHR